MSRPDLDINRIINELVRYSPEAIHVVGCMYVIESDIHDTEKGSYYMEYIDYIHNTPWGETKYMFISNSKSLAEHIVEEVKADLDIIEELEDYSFGRGRMLD